MGDTLLGILSVLAAGGLLWMIVSQWRSNRLFDPILSAFSDDFYKPALLWCTTVLYGTIAVASVALAAHFFARG